MPVRSNSGRNRQGFTLIEVLVATVLIGIGVTAAVTGLGTLAGSRARFLETERLRTLAYQKWDEIAQTAGPNAWDESGNFDSEGLPAIQFRSEGRDVGVPDLTELVVTVTNAAGRDEAVSGLVYRAPASTNVSGATP